jgi:hypothetical protein
MTESQQTRIAVACQIIATELEVISDQLRRTAKALRPDQAETEADGQQAHVGEEYPPDRFHDPERQAPARPSNRPDRGDAWEPPVEDPEDEDEGAPRDGRQLLGWASKQIPDLKGTLIGYGKKKGLHSKIVAWTPQEVAAAYRFARARARSASTR